MRRQLLCRAQGHGRAHAEAPRLVRGGRDDATAVGVAADDDGLAPQLGPARLLHGHEEGVEIDVEDAYARSCPFDSTFVLACQGARVPAPFASLRDERNGGRPPVPAGEVAMPFQLRTIHCSCRLRPRSWSSPGRPRTALVTRGQPTLSARASNLGMRGQGAEPVEDGERLRYSARGGAPAVQATSNPRPAASRRRLASSYTSFGSGPFCRALMLS